MAFQSNFNQEGAGGELMKKTVAFFEILTALLLLAVPLLAQTCVDTIFVSDTTISASVANTRAFKIPIVLANNCRVGGFEFILTTSNPNVLLPIAADTLGSRLCFHTDTTDSSGHAHIDTLLPWEYFQANRGVEFPESLFVAAIADYPSNPTTTRPLDDGRGKIFNIQFEIPCTYMRPNLGDTTVELRIERVYVSDSTGQLQSVTYYNSLVTLHMGASIRGDANCDGIRRGSDVSRLVSYFKGVSICPCSLNAGDANGDGQIRGSDVTFLVRYFKGLGPEPPPN
jgi:hypothetical protein